ncbi:MAG: PAS domain-containing protein [Planctomycetes bacterium]|nr:PAS domain-containing protein [Planctomycetota bacterium]
MAQEAEKSDLITQKIADLLGQLSEIEHQATASLASEAKYRALVEQLPGITYTAALDGRRTIKYVSPSIRQSLGISPQELLDRPDVWHDLIVPDDLGMVMDAVGRCQATVAPLRIEYRMRRRDGRTLWFHDEATIVNDPAGRPALLQGFLLDITERKQAEQQARRAAKSLDLERHFLVQILSAVDAIVIILDGNWRIASINPACQRCVGYSQQELAGREFAAALLPAEDAAAADMLPKDVKEGFLPVAREGWWTAKDGARKWVSWSYNCTSDEAGNLQYVICAGVDLTGQKKIEQELRASQERYALAIQGANDGLWDWDMRANRMYFSPRWKQMIGCDDGQIGGDPREWFSRVLPEDLSDLQDAIDEHLRRSSPYLRHEYRIHSRDDRIIWVLTQGLALFDEQGRPYRMAGSQTDITRRKLMEEQLRLDATFDMLSGVFNRRWFMENLEISVDSSRRYGHPLSLCLCDIDHFKRINDQFGHRAGDKVLVKFGHLLREEVRVSDIVGRYGGDEFAIIFPHTSAAQAGLCLDRICRRFRSVIFGADSGLTFTCTATFGVADFVHGPMTPGELVEHADRVLYHAKQLGRDRVLAG